MGAGERTWSEKCPSDHLVGLGLILSSHLKPGLTAPVTPALGTEAGGSPGPRWPAWPNPRAPGPWSVESAGVCGGAHEAWGEWPQY